MQGHARAAVVALNAAISQLLEIGLAARLVGPIPAFNPLIGPLAGCLSQRARALSAEGYGYSCTTAGPALYMSAERGLGAVVDG